MKPGRTYLDYNASAPLLPEAREAMLAALALDGNPSSVHAEGRRLRSMIEQARADVAALCGAGPAEVVFTSGASEANATVLQSGFDIALRPAVEHDSVLAPITRGGATVVELPVTHEGIVDLAAIARALDALPDGARAVIALQLANNETGVIQPVAAVAKLVRDRLSSTGAPIAARRLHLHCDAVQAPGRMAIDAAALGVDTLVLSAHKIGGPKGAGALIIRNGAAISPLIAGGGQERRRRAGTENVAAIVGFGAAARVALGSVAETSRMAVLRDRLEAGIRAVTPDAVVIGDGAPRLVNTSAIALPGLAADILLIKFDLAGFAISSGSACSSGKVGASHVLSAMGIDPTIARAAIRVSLGTATTVADIERFIAAWRDITQPSRANVPDRTDPLTPATPIIMYAAMAAPTESVGPVRLKSSGGR
ncbi:MAG: cysteine desulfurase family protein [Hyphomicrobium aestuarii]|nr:cysteine desulfurase family protein [Hyphomicrobium aestuarii]